MDQQLVVDALRSATEAVFSTMLGLEVESAAPFIETSLEWQLFEDLTYDLPHTLPFVCDQVVTFPRSTTLMLVAARPDFVSAFAKAWQGMGFTGPVLVPKECSNLPTDQPGIETGPFSRLLKRADMSVHDIVKLTQYLLHPADIPAYAQVRTRYLGGAQPASLLLIAPGLVRPEFLLEIEVCAAKA